jgi:arylsulfatase A-like enzyme
MKHIVNFSVAILLLVGTCAAANKEQKSSKPNVLFIAIDDLRTELGCYGKTQVLSPNIDKLAAQGLIFDRAYCNVPVCGASRACLLTGILPTKTRFIDFNTRADEDAPNARTLPQVFKENGYETVSFGKIFHNGADALERSWTQRVTGNGFGHTKSYDPATIQNGKNRIYEAPDVEDDAYGDGIVAKNTIQELQRLQKAGTPFFLACGFIRPHLPFYAPKKYWDLYNRDSIKIAPNRYRPENAPSALNGSGEYKSYSHGEYKDKTIEFNKMMRHGYFASTSYADKLTGDVLNELEKLGLAENTIVVIWGDHGWHLGEHDFWGKHNTLHNALQIPLIIKVPGKTSGKKTQALVESVDIFPTLCELAGLKTPRSVMGKSFTKLLENPNQNFREAVYSRFKAADAIVTKDFNYSKYDNGEEMLYNREIDPEENKNVVNDPQYSGTLQKMKSYLKENVNIANEYDN